MAETQIQIVIDSDMLLTLIKAKEKSNGDYESNRVYESSLNDIADIINILKSKINDR